MKQDMELVEKILLEIEKRPSSEAGFGLKIDGYDAETIAQHCKLLYKHGFVDGYTPFYGSNSLYTFTVGGLTWEGQDFLNRIQDENTWAKIKRWIEEKAMPFTIEAIKDAIIAMISGGSK